MPTIAAFPDRCLQATWVDDCHPDQTADGTAFSTLRQAVVRMRYWHASGRVDDNQCHSCWESARIAASTAAASRDSISGSGAIRNSSMSTRIAAGKQSSSGFATNTRPCDPSARRGSALVALTTPHCPHRINRALLRVIRRVRASSAIWCANSADMAVKVFRNAWAALQRERVLGVGVIECPRPARVGHGRRVHRADRGVRIVRPQPRQGRPCFL